MEVEGSWPADDIRRVFVAGAKWWEFHSTGGTMWPSDVELTEIEATKRYAVPTSRSSGQAKCCGFPDITWNHDHTKSVCVFCGSKSPAA